MAESRNNPWLDLVRCAAILLVLFRHGERAVTTTSNGGQGFVETLFLNGWVGVDLFFALSGYLITRHLVGAGIGTGRFALGRYLALRALRIVPAYVAVMALIIAGAFPFFEIGREALPMRVAYHLLFLQDYLPSNINVVFWSLGVEEKFYLLAPLLVAALLRLPMIAKAPLLVACFGLPLIFRSATFQGLDSGIGYNEFFQIFRSPFHMTLEGFVVGVAIAMAERAGLIRPRRGRGLALLSVSASILCIWLASHDFMARIGFHDAALQPALIALLAGAIILGAVMLAGSPMPLTQPARALSRLSYSLYLVHLPLIPLAKVLSGTQGVPGFWAIYLATSLAVAVLLHRGVEKPFLDWKDRLAARPPTQRGHSAAYPVAVGSDRP